MRRGVAALVSCCSAAAQTGDVAARVDALIRERFAATKAPGISVAVSIGDAIVFSTGIGMADLEQGVAMKAASVHRLASISKPITGTIIMDLVTLRKLELDVPVRRYLPELAATHAEVTLRRLLDHQSGIGGDEGAETAFSVEHYATCRDAMKVFAATPPRFQPGTKTEYSSVAFTVVGAAAEAATGRSFQQLSAEFFTRHGLHGIALDDPLAVIPGRVRGYLVDRDSSIEFNDGRTMKRDYLAGTPGAVTNARPFDITNRYPAGGFTASAEDLLRFAIAVAAAKVVPPAAVREMWTAQARLDGTRGPFGIGWGVSEWRGRKMVGMNGASPASTTFLRYFPESRAGVALLANAEGATGLPEMLEGILAAVFR